MLRGLTGEGLRNFDWEDQGRLIRKVLFKVGIEA